MRPGSLTIWTSHGNSRTTGVPRPITSDRLTPLRIPPNDTAASPPRIATSTYTRGTKAVPTVRSRPKPQAARRDPAITRVASAA
ncbi:hypothetical protein [Microbispora sp. GKU 823]|uniref:hypothetical protein n=1 Tax=Microbispora sp. GKU 823 TaxID=1652100 RepID=UPI0009C6EF3C|nr:hypothetical protein [Microbispora sp. GKU 823]OPG14046.1 hypothetical protein B1L11_04485 [Microbispora sp. GKU 823]